MPFTAEYTLVGIRITSDALVSSLFCEVPCDIFIWMVCFCRRGYGDICVNNKSKILYYKVKSFFLPYLLAP